MIRILVVDDSPSVVMLLSAVIGAQPDMQVVGHAVDGAQAVRLTRELNPDVITMDVRMPGIDGIEATRLIMESVPTPIVIVSGVLGDPELRVMFRALEVGAVAVFEKPPGPAHPKFATVTRDLVDTLRAMASVKVLRRRPRDEAASPASSQGSPSSPSARQARRGLPPHLASMHGAVHGRVAAIAASTGGPQALAAVLSNLPADFPLPVVVVQHISPGFIGGMVEWINDLCRLECRVASDGETLAPGLVLFAPDDRHLTLVAQNMSLKVKLHNGEAVRGHKPSATPMFDSVARLCGSQAIGLILTGMGADGADGLLRLRHAGALTLAQSPETCVVPNMPQSAIAMNAVTEVLPLAQLAQRLQAAAFDDAVESAVVGLDDPLKGGDADESPDR